MVKRFAQVAFTVTSGATVTTTFPPQLSVVVIAPTFGTGIALAQDTVTFGGQVIAGPVLSSTVMV